METRITKLGANRIEIEISVGISGDLIIENRDRLAALCNTATISAAALKYDPDPMKRVAEMACEVGFSPSEISETIARLKGSKGFGKEFGDETMAFLNRMDGIETNMPKRKVAGTMPLAIPMPGDEIYSMGDPRDNATDVADGTLSYAANSGTMYVRLGGEQVAISSPYQADFKRQAIGDTLLKLGQSRSAPRESPKPQEQERNAVDNGDEIQSRITALEFDEPNLVQGKTEGSK